MEKYRPKTFFAEFADRVLRICVTFLIGIAWFVFLWGLSLPAVCAGMSLGVLIWLCVRQFAKQITHRREKQMRQFIGGELALEKLLLDSPPHAALQCARWIAPRYPLKMERIGHWCVTGTLNGRKAAMRLIAQHAAQSVSVQQILECARKAREQKDEQTILCLTAPASREAAVYAASLDPPVHIVSRAELIELAGHFCPASDDDLRRLGKQKRTRRSPKEWLAVILDGSRTRRYWWYGIGLSVFAVWTGNAFYPFPAAICLLLSAASRLRSSQLISRRRHWKA